MTPHEKLIRRIDTSGECWVWQGATSDVGYGHIYLNKKMLLTHRVSYEIFRGPIPPGLEIDHLCRNRACCRPDHLEAVTRTVNARRGIRGQQLRELAAARTHCKNGHQFSGDNLRIAIYRGRPWRQCRACARAAFHRNKRRREAA